MKKFVIKHKQHIGVAIIFLLALVSFLLLSLQVLSDRRNEIVLHISAEEERNPEVEVRSNVTKYWLDKDAKGVPCTGAQYDIYVENHMNGVLIDWRMEIVIPAEARIDSAWNGEYVIENGMIYYTPEKSLDIAKVKPGATENFGFIMYSAGILKFTDFTIIGHKQVDLLSYPLLYIGFAFTALGVISQIWQVTLRMRTKKLEQRRINDEKIIVETMLTLANFIDAKDEYTKGHSIRVSAYAVKIAKRMHLEEDEIRQLSYIALMHDCGKMGIPDTILNKPGKLTPEERAIVEQHTVMGGKILESMTAIPGIQDGALYHHERFDGKGYPEGLKNVDIPLYARIIGVADSFDAMNSDRCYRKRLSMETIKNELEKNAGKQFDPEIVKYMLQIIEEKDFA